MPLGAEVASAQASHSGPDYWTGLRGSDGASDSWQMPTQAGEAGTASS